jgi:hypothetical protein
MSNKAYYREHRTTICAFNPDDRTILLDYDHFAEGKLYLRGDNLFSFKICDLVKEVNGLFKYRFTYGDAATGALVKKLYASEARGGDPSLVGSELYLTAVQSEQYATPDVVEDKEVVDYNQLIRGEAISALFQIKGKTIPENECEYQGDSDFQILMYSFRKIINTVKS